MVNIGALTLENGTVLPDVSIAVQRWGELSPARDNVVMVLHALTGDSHVTGPAGDGHPTAGWWDGVAGPGAPIDTDQWCAISTNVLGGCQGSTGPGSLAPDGKPWGQGFPRSRFAIRWRPTGPRWRPSASPRWPRWSAGRWAEPVRWNGSSGIPTKSGAGLVLAVGARATADQIGTQSSQVAAIKADPDWQGGDYYDTDRAPLAGMEIARRFAHLTYRGEEELDERFRNDAQGDEDPTAGGRYGVQSYLEYQGGKLARRFDPGTYVTLSDALSTHDVGRDRSGVTTALRGCPVPVIVGGITSDRLYPIRLQEELADLLPGCSGLDVVDSAYGHDGFLVETEVVGKLIRRTLELAQR